MIDVDLSTLANEANDVLWHSPGGHGHLCAALSALAFKVEQVQKGELTPEAFCLYYGVLAGEPQQAQP